MSLPPGLRIDEGALEGLSPAERAAVVDELRLVDEAFKANPLLGYHPHSKQQIFHAPLDGGSWPHTRLFLGGNRSGKTTCTMVDTILQCVDADVIPAHLKAFKRWGFDDRPFYGRVITPDLTSTLDGVVLQKFREWCPKAQFKGGSFDRAWDKVQRVLWFKNGSWVQFFSNDQDLDKFGGAALHRVVYDEEPRSDIRRESMMRLIDFGGEELFGMTPLSGMSWVYDEFFEPWEAGELTAESVRLVTVDMDDNPTLDRGTQTRILAGLSEEERQARKSGRFVAFSGLIYPEFRSSSHVIPGLDSIPLGVEVLCGIDPGIRHMCAVVYAFLDHDDRLVVFDEIALKGATVAEVCREIQLRNLRWGVLNEKTGKISPLHPRMYIIDPASRNRANQTGRSDQQEFADNGVVTIPGQNDVRAGINRVKERMQASPPKLVVAANCPEILSEIKKYRWTRESGRSENEARDTPVKKDDHLLDALRYVSAQRPLVPERERALPSDTMKDRLLRESLKRLTRGGRKSVPDGHFFGGGQFQ